jgi:hypothetical protein
MYDGAHMSACADLTTMTVQPWWYGFDTLTGRFGHFLAIAKKSGDEKYGRMARGGHGLPKVSIGPAKHYPSTPCGRVTSETTLWPFQGLLAYRAGSLRPSASSLYTPRQTPMLKKT